MSSSEYETSDAVQNKTVYVSHPGVNQNNRLGNDWGK